MRHQDRPQRIALVFAICVLVFELLLGHALGHPSSGLPPELAAITNGVVLGVFVAIGFYLAGHFMPKRDDNSSMLARVSDSATIGLLATGFEGTMHTPLTTLLAPAGLSVQSIVNAFVMAVVCGTIAWWLLFVRRQVAEQSGRGHRSGRNANVLLAGALLGGAYIAAIPSLAVFNNKLAWERQVGAGELINLAGRQRMLSQRIGRLAMADGTADQAELRSTIEIAASEGVRVDELASAFADGSRPDGDKQADRALLEEYSRRRGDYLAAAALLADEETAGTRSVLNEVLQARIDAFLPVMNLAVGEFERIADGFAGRQARVIPLRLVLGGIVIFGSVVGLMLSVLRLIKTQQSRLSERRKEAESANEAKSMFLANMSHEIRTPLNGVLGMAQVLETRDLGEKEMEMVRTIQSSGTTLMTILNDVLDLSKIEAGKLDIVATEEGLRQCLQRSFDMFAALAEERELDYSLTFDDALPDVMQFDPARVQQCVSNLISNAVKFTESGSVSVRAGVNANGLVEVTVRDTGIGMDEDTCVRLFSAFTQADGSTSRKFGGTGLGLAISRKLARAMDGDLTATSELGRGSAFTLTFAAERVAQPATSLASESGAAGGVGRATELNGARVLLVDDNDVNRKVVSLILAPTGVVVEEAENGLAALSKLENSAPFDIMLLDAHMPVMDGEETIKRLRASKEGWSDMPVIALTADAMRGDHERFLAMGMDGYVSKPINQAQLFSEINRLLARNAAPQLAAAS